VKIELDYIEKLAELVTKNELTEITVEDGEKVVVIRKELAITQTAPAAAIMPSAMQTAPQPQIEAAQNPPEEASNKVKITSPMVGTFYKAPSPETAPFIEVGKTVGIGQVVCIIEAMKLMNEIEAEVSGKVVEICVEDGQPVEFGQTLMVVEP